MLKTCKKYLNLLCEEISERPVGSQGNQQANQVFLEIVESFGWKVESTQFKSMDWLADGAEIFIDQESFEVFPSPYSHGCDLEAELVTAGTRSELDKVETEGKILLLHDELTKEQLMPKEFVFYNPVEHQQIITALEKNNPAAILAATSRNASLAGGVYPFPLIEDGDFQIPSLFMTEEEGQKLLSKTGKIAALTSRARRIPAKSETLSARKGTDFNKRISISAHIDAKIGTPGAIDNATGVIILMLLAEELQNYTGTPGIELLPFNGEDYYAASGQMVFLRQNMDRFNEILININIDGAGYQEGPSAFSPFNLPEKISRDLKDVINGSDKLILGEPWYQGDHSIFIQQGVPAIAISSKWFVDHVDSQDITHTPKDHPGIVDCKKLVEISQGIMDFISKAYLS